MSSVRRLLTKSNTAPSSTATARPRLQLPNHGSAEEQLLAIQQQHERTQLHDEKLKSFTTKVKTQKLESKNERHKSQWLSERTCLFDDREKAQAEVDGMWANLEGQFAVNASNEEADKADVPIRLAVKTLRMECANDRSGTVDVSRAVLTSVLGLRARVISHITHRQNQDSSTAAKAQKELDKQQTELQVALGHLKKCLDEERHELAALVQHEVGPTGTVARDGMEKMLHQLKNCSVGDLCDGSVATELQGGAQTVDEIEAEIDMRLEEIRNRCPHSSDDAQGLFRGSLGDIVQQARIRLEALSATLSSGSPVLTLDEDSRLRVEMLIRSYDPSRNRSMFGKTRDELFDRLQHDLPEVFPTVKAARDAVLIVEGDRVRRREHRVVLSQLHQDVERLIRCLADVSTAEENIFLMNETFRRQKQLDEERDAARHKEIEAARILHDDRTATKMAAEASVREAAKALEDARRQRLQEEFDARLTELARHHQERAEANQRQLEANELIRQATEEEKAAAAQHNAQRVEVRHQAHAARLDELRLQKLLADEAATRKKDAYNAFFASVEASLGVTRDVERVLRGTVSSTQEAGSGYVGAVEAAAAKSRGFMMEGLLKDPRFKIHQALVAANLHQTAYARHVMNSAQFHRVAPSMVPSANNTLAHR